MVELWYGIVAFMIITYVVLDGRNFGAGILYYFVAPTAAERRQVIAAIGPLWIWHEVWLVGFGGTLFVAFPILMATAFSGYYLALFLILWCLVFRGFALEAGGHIPDKMWRSFWDVIFTVSNFLLAILFGAAMGNLVRGVPLDAHGEFSMAFFTDFRTTGHVGLLDWYTVSMSMVALVFLAAHGATYLTLRTEGAVHTRCVRAMQWLWALVPVFGAIITAETWVVRPDFFTGMAQRPLSWLCVLVCVVAAIMIFTGIRARHEMRTFLGSGTLIVGLLANGAATIFPVVLRTTLPDGKSLTAPDAAASLGSLRLALLWWPLAAALAFGYLVYIAHHFSGKIAAQRDGTDPY